MSRLPIENLCPYQVLENTDGLATDCNYEVAVFNDGCYARWEDALSSGGLYQAPYVCMGRGEVQDVETGILLAQECLGYANLQIVFRLAPPFRAVESDQPINYQTGDNVMTECGKFMINIKGVL